MCVGRGGGVVPSVMVDGEPRAKQSETQALVVRAIYLSERSLIMGVAQASGAL